MADLGASDQLDRHATVASGLDQPDRHAIVLASVTALVPGRHAIVPASVTAVKLPPVPGQQATVPTLLRTLVASGLG